MTRTVFPAGEQWNFRPSGPEPVGPPYLTLLSPRGSNFETCRVIGHYPMIAVTRISFPW